MRVLVFGMSADKFGGIESFLLNMNRHMNGECIFDYVIVGKSCIYEDKVKAGGGKVFYTTPYSQNPFKHLKELRQIVKECRDTHKTAFTFTLYKKKNCKRHSKNYCPKNDAKSNSSIRNDFQKTVPDLDR